MPSGTWNDLVSQVQALYEQEKYQEILGKLSNQTLTPAKYRKAELFVERAKAYWKLKEYDKALKDLNTAKALRSDYAPIYNCRGNVKSDLGQNAEAISDYDEAIRLSPDDAIVYYNRAIAKYDLGQYEEAIKDYDEAIRLNPEYTNAYNNRGVAKYDLGQYKEAIKDYDKVIELNPNDAYAYNNRGNAEYALAQYEEAIKDYDKAIDLNPDISNAIYWRERALEKLQESKQKIAPKKRTKKVEKENIEVKNEAKEPFKVLRFFQELCEGIENEQDRNKVEKISSDIYFTELEALHKLVVEVDEKKLAHYTKLNVADLLICNRKKDKDTGKVTITCNADSKFRYYNSGYMNDPMEGRVLIDYLLKQDVKKAFLEGEKGEESNVYIGSFVSVRDDDMLNSHDDDLVLWRTYGKDGDKNEASGCCLVIDFAFFDKHTENVTDGKSDNMRVRGSDKQPLYKIIYCDRNGAIIGDTNGAIKNSIENFERAINRLLSLKNDNKKDSKNSIIDKIVFHLVSEVRFFFKLADFQYESELRVIQFVAPDSDEVLLDEIDRLYINSKQAVTPFLSKLVLGPKVQNSEHWIYLSAIMAKAGHKIELRRSKIDFR